MCRCGDVDVEMCRCSNVRICGCGAVDIWVCMVVSHSTSITAGLIKSHDVITSEFLDSKAWHGGMEHNASCILKCIYCTACDYMLTAILVSQAARPPKHLIISLVPPE